MWGADGARRLADLPALLAGSAGDWDLTLGAAYDLTLHYVAAVRRADGSPAVPIPAGLVREAAVLLRRP